MLKAWRYDDDARREDAAAWVVRLEAAALCEAEALAFDSWLSDSPENALAFDSALLVSQTYVAAAAPVARALSGRGAERARPPAIGRRAVVGVGAMAAAAAVAVLVAPQLTVAQTETYVTAKGERRTVELSDGSKIDLNGGTHLTVAFDREARHVTLEGGQAVFDVTHDARRPFFVAAGDRMVRVVGTQFDVRRLGGKVSVTVARGAVEVRPGEGSTGRAFRLHPGQRLEHFEGRPGAVVAAAEPEEVLGWRTGRLVYRGQPLGEVVADLNQQFATPIRIEDAALAATPISGVLVVDDQDAVIRRLALLVPVSAVRSGPGVVLRRDPASDR
ncbi:MAG: iron dicitrate transport regulator FecR [Phenylobacterium zucineum]|nr:MAG: iron dicitrate transport regulator FecR [Phenylobacterium zucineum]